MGSWLVIFFACNFVGIRVVCVFARYHPRQSVCLWWYGGMVVAVVMVLVLGGDVDMGCCCC